MQRRLVCAGKFGMRARTSAPRASNAASPSIAVDSNSDDARQRCAGFTQVLERSARIDEEQRALGVLEDVRRVIERLRRIDRHDDAAGKERREIADDPVDAVVRDQRDAIAVLQARRRESRTRHFRRARAGARSTSASSAPATRSTSASSRGSARAARMSAVASPAGERQGIAVSKAKTSEATPLRPLSSCQIRPRARQAALRHAGDVEQLVKRRERALAFAQFDDARGDGTTDAGDARKLVAARAVDVDAAFHAAPSGVRPVPSRGAMRRPAAAPCRLARPRHQHFFTVRGSLGEIDAGGIGVGAQSPG